MMLIIRSLETKPSYSIVHAPVCTLLTLDAAERPSETPSGIPVSFDLSNKPKLQHNQLSSRPTVSASVSVPHCRKAIAQHPDSSSTVTSADTFLVSSLIPMQGRSSQARYKDK